MAKTYTAAGSATAGEVYTASAHNVIVTDVNNFIVPPMVRLKKTTTQSLTSSTWTYVQWDEDFDTDNMFSSGANTEIVFDTAGVYMVSTVVRFNTNGTGIRLLSAAKNPTSASFTDTFMGSWAPAYAGAETVLSCSSLVSLAAGDKIRVMVFQSSGGALTIGAIPSYTNDTHFSAVWVGRTS